NQRYLWPNFKSPLVWDVFAISTYLTISVVFFIVGLVPDVAALRDNATGFKKKIYAVISLGWEGSDSQCRHYRRAPPPPPPPRRPRPAPGAVRAQRGVVRLRHGPGAGLALDALRSLLRGRGHLLRLRHGAHPDVAHALYLQLVRLHHGPAPRCHGQADTAHQPHPHLLLHLRGVHRLVQR